MNISVEWLNSYLDKPLSTREMAAALERAGVEVEAVGTATDLDSKVVVGKVNQVEAHPDADKLRLAQVDVGAATLGIVCGAPNLTAGQTVPVALVGAVLPDGSRIAAAKLRGVASNGMICSREELGLAAGEPGIMILDTDAAPGTPIAEVIGKNDVIDATTTANRWDLNGMVWLAHEVAAHSGRHLLPGSYEHNSGSVAAKGSSAELATRVDASGLVGRYLLAKLDTAAAASPSWLTVRLQAAGIRPIGAIVDITNYCMLEYGQPLHAFDSAKVTLPITVRNAHAGETLVTLDDIERRLDPADLVIADAKGPIALAGVMGGANSEIDEHTTAIYLESASFNGSVLRQTALRHGLRTDASARFERRIPVDLAPIALRRAIGLLEELTEAKLTAGPVDHLQTPSVLTAMTASSGRINALLGLELSAARMAEELTKLHFKAETDSQEELSIGVPWWRPDVRTEEDIAEEVIKLVGYDQLPATLPAWKPAAIEFDSSWEPRWRAKGVLRSCGLFEIVSYSFVSQEQITTLGRDPHSFLKLKNPLSRQQSHLRIDLLPSLLQVAERNRTYARRFGLYEFSKVYQPRSQGELPLEPLHLGILIRAEAGGYRRVKAVLDRLSTVFNVPVELRLGRSQAATEVHPTRSAELLVGKEVIGWIAQLHPVLTTRLKLGGEVGYLEFDWERFIAAARPHLHQPASRFPAVSRDISIVVDRAVSWQQVRSVLATEAVSFIDDYYGSEVPAGHKAMTIRFSFSAPDRTLTDKEADNRIAVIIKRLEESCSAKLRD
jgi:phenylalanyl-tRNA synthetase beta chain